MKTRKYNYIFGPVPSRRLGHSLGIDIIPFKTCSYDCIYCQLGKTTNKTISLSEFIPINTILNELKQKLKENVKIDYITLSGSGEPTLYLKIGELISSIKNETDKPIALITNSSLLWNKSLQENLKNIDLIIPSLDAGDKDIFEQINRPHEKLSFEKVVNGIIDFSNYFQNKIWLEIFLLEGINTINKRIEKIALYAEKIRTDKIQLNTVTRPPLEPYVKEVSMHKINDIKKYFKGNVEVISKFKKINEEQYCNVSMNEILNLIKRRPCSLEDICNGLNISKIETIKYLELLKKENKIKIINENSIFYYCIV